ncbi:MAG: hypothetical protein NTV46_13360 [Verrucomicrobia bacterium]|nr:hypothetical protein [Verrucomicrobiota bacterium]
MPDTLIELQRCRDAASVKELTQILNDAGIPHRVGSSAPIVDISTIGSGNEAQVIVSVRAKDYDAARAAMEEDSLQIELPMGHYLLTSSDDELAEIIAQANDWSAFDVAHARRLLNDRGVEPSKIAEKKAERLNELRTGKKATMFLLCFGWLCVLLGGLVGLGIAWSLCYSKDMTPDGEFFTYDIKSREAGKPMLTCSCLMIVLYLFIGLYGFLNP